VQPKAINLGRLSINPLPAKNIGH